MFSTEPILVSIRRAASVSQLHTRVAVRLSDQVSFYVAAMQSRVPPGLAAADPAGLQQHVLDQLIERGKGTWFGKKYSLASVRTGADLARAVPIRDYVADLDVFHRILAGEPDDPEVN